VSPTSEPILRGSPLYSTGVDLLVVPQPVGLTLMRRQRALMLPSGASPAHG